MLTGVCLHWLAVGRVQATQQYDPSHPRATNLPSLSKKMAIKLSLIICLCALYIFLLSI